MHSSRIWGAKDPNRKNVVLHLFLDHADDLTAQLANLGR